MKKRLIFTVAVLSFFGSYPCHSEGQTTHKDQKKTKALREARAATIDSLEKAQAAGILLTKGQIANIKDGTVSRVDQEWIYEKIQLLEAYPNPQAQDHDVAVITFGKDLTATQLAAMLKAAKELQKSVQNQITKQGYYVTARETVKDKNLLK